jgi:hypothetical protein
MLVPIWLVSGCVKELERNIDFGVTVWGGCPQAGPASALSPGDRIVEIGGVKLQMCPPGLCHLLSQVAEL